MSQVVVPDIGDFKEVEVIEVLVKPGDAVSKEQSLITLESDKATMEIPSPAAGVVKALKVKTGDKVSQGTPILELDAKEEPKTEAKKESAKTDAPRKEEKRTEEPRREAAAPTASAGPGTSSTVPVPDIGDFKEVEVIEVLVKPGDKVAKEQSLITLESDKATMEIPSPGAGVVKELKVKVGDKVSKGMAILVLEGTEQRSEPRQEAPKGEAPKAEARKAEAAVKAASPAPARAPQPAAGSGGPKPHASPSVRKFARELGVDLTQVHGSGPKGRILHADIQGFVKGALSGKAPAKAPAGGALPFNLPAWPDVDFAKFGPVEPKPLSRIQKLSGPYLHRNWISIPHVTQFDEADITDLEAFRKAQTAETEKKGFKLTMLAFMIKACVTALKQYPQFNASLDKSGESLIIKKYYSIGVAVDTPGGLVVPVVKEADRKGVFDVAQELAEISKKARDGKLSPGDMQGGTFSISSLGGIGGTYFTPIINAPELAILGVSRAATKPVWDGKTFAPRLIMPLSLSYDHRAIDGATAARFTSFLVSVLSDIRKLIL